MSLENILVTNTEGRAGVAVVSLDFKGTTEVEGVKPDDEAQPFKVKGATAFQETVAVSGDSKILMTAVKFPNTASLYFHKKDLSPDGNAVQMNPDDIITIGEKLKASGLTDIVPAVTAMLEDTLESSKQQTVHISSHMIKARLRTGREGERQQG